MNAVICDLIAGKIAPQTATAITRAGDQLLKSLEMQLKYGDRPPEGERVMLPMDISNPLRERLERKIVEYLQVAAPAKPAVISSDLTIDHAIVINVLQGNPSIFREDKSTGWRLVL